MLKHTLLALVGLAVVAPAASADADLPLLPRPDLSAEITPFEAPAFDRMVDLCERFGVACSVPGADRYAHADIEDLFELIPLAQADAAKRWALYAEEWTEIAEFYEDYAPAEVPTFEFPQIADGYGWHHPGYGRLAEITELLEDMQDRLDRRVAPVHVVPTPRLGWQSPFNSWSHRLGQGHAGTTIIRPHAPHLPGNSVIILPSR